MKHDRIQRGGWSAAVLLLSAILFSAAAPAEQEQNEIIGRVVRVIDGDTFVVRLQQSGIEERVRVIGLDTPETKHPRKPVEYYGREASTQAKKLLDRQTIILRLDQANAHLGHRDRYQRLLAHPRLPDGAWFAERMIGEGYGHALTRYPFDAALQERYRAAERTAREAGLGLWSQ